MNEATAKYYAAFAFHVLWGNRGYPSYIEVCKAAHERGEDWPSEHLIKHEQAERLDFDSWGNEPGGVFHLAQRAARNGRCDIIEKYAPRWPTAVWNHAVAMWYAPCLYPILGLVMALPIPYLAAVENYVDKGLHREVAVHIIGRKCGSNEDTITPESIAVRARTAQSLENLGEIGLDLGNPQHLYRALKRNNYEQVALLQQHCIRLDEVMPDGKTLREMLNERGL